MSFIGKVKDKNNVDWVPIETEPIKIGESIIGDKIKDKYKSGYVVEKFTTKLNTSNHYEKLIKPVISEDKLLTTEEISEVKLALNNAGMVDEKNKVIREGHHLIMRELMPAKNDYKHDFDRGTVHYTPNNRNYSYHKVIIPDGTIITECNFTQKSPHTVAIEGKNLKFVRCNLVNVEIDSSWEVEGNTSQIKRVLVEQKTREDGKKVLVVSHQLEKSPGVYTEQSRKEDICRDESDLENKLRKYEVA